MCIRKKKHASPDFADAPSRSDPLRSDPLFFRGPPGVSFKWLPFGSKTGTVATSLNSAPSIVRCARRRQSGARKKFSFFARVVAMGSFERSPFSLSALISQTLRSEPLRSEPLPCFSGVPPEFLSSGFPSVLKPGGGRINCWTYRSAPPSRGLAQVRPVSLAPTSPPSPAPPLPGRVRCRW